MDNSIQFLVDNFVKQIVATVEAAAARRMQAAVSVALGAGSAVALKRRPGRPAKASYVVSPAVTAPAKRRPKQLCPVPGCRGVAAPVFGMVCSEHKKVSKALIKKYRAERRAAK
ncbi:MAG TPA: hypothetical protein VJ860_11190 [Polyangia bacterium]|jgi:hypothetical protein|nr:hypothetical protein [Polyangia bacterium]